ncbi:MAG: Teichoic acid translocation permease protein TagG [Herminiimonas sp.]|nr:Teichoic acid translocation permease protein TagG [Herminiimonas sp.]
MQVKKKIGHKPTTPFSVFSSFWSQKELIWQLSKREVIGRYRGSIFGLLWSFVIPVLMLTIYTFVFSYIFQARWGGGTESKADYALFLFAGLIVHTLFAECVVRAPGLIIGNVNFVKRVVFPIEVLPWVAMLSGIFHTTLSIVALLVFYAAIHSGLHWTVVFLPIVLFPLILFTMGVSWFLASAGTFVRDVGQTVGIMTTVLLFMSPIFYPASILPKNIRPLLFLNPLTFIIEQARDVLIMGNTPAWMRLGIYYAISVLMAWLGLYWFQKTRKGFADVL